MSSDRLIEHLNQLIGHWADLSESLAQAARPGRGAIQTSQTTVPRDPVGFTEELVSLIELSGGVAARGGATRGTLQWAVGSMRRLMQGRNDVTMRDACQRDEQTLMRAYETTCDLNPPIGIASVLMRQYGAIKRSHYERFAQSITRRLPVHDAPAKECG